MKAVAARILRYINIAIVIAIIAMGINSCYGPPKFWSDYKGWKEADVVAHLGKPPYDSRVIGPKDKPGEPYTLFWYYGFGNQLVMMFDADGKVIEQQSGSK